MDTGLIPTKATVITLNTNVNSMSVNIQVHQQLVSERAKEYKKRIQPFINIIQDIIETSPHPGYTIDLANWEMTTNVHPKQSEIDAQLDIIFDIQKEYRDLFDEQDFLNKY